MFTDVPGWSDFVRNEFSESYMLQLQDFLKIEYESNPDQIFPPKNKIFAALEACSFDQTKVIILGQDPYPTKGHAHGLSFSVDEKLQKLPKSLQNILTELKQDVGSTQLVNGALIPWAKQGVLLLNAVLTVRESEPGSHAKKGWEQFTDRLIQYLSQEKESLVFLLWGNYAISKSNLIDKTKHTVLSAPHPSPLSAHRGFYGCRHFSKTNEILLEKGLKPIEW